MKKYNKKFEIEIEIIYLLVGVNKFKESLLISY